jgi:hypothetical protein
LYFGTDVNDTDAFNYHSSLYTLVLTALDSAEDFDWGKYHNCAGLGLSDTAKEKIKSGNFIKLLGKTPKPLDYALINEEIARLESISDTFSDDDKQMLLSLKQYFSDK